MLSRVQKKEQVKRKKKVNKVPNFKSSKCLQVTKISTAKKLKAKLCKKSWKMKKS